MIGKPFYKEGINSYKINKNILNMNSNAISLINENDIYCRGLCTNSNGVELLKKNVPKIWNDFTACLYHISSNPNLLNFLMDNFHKNDWDWKGLCKNLNPKVIPLLINNIDKLGKTEWEYLCENPNAMCIIENNIDKISWEHLAKNINAISFLEKHLNNFDESIISQKIPNYRIEDFWMNIFSNKNAINIIQKYFYKKVETTDDIYTKYKYWYSLFKNTNDIALKMIEENIDILKDIREKLKQNENHKYWYNTFWYNLSENSNSVPILKKNVDIIYWTGLASNFVDIKAMDLIVDNLNELDYRSWMCLSGNPNAMHILYDYDYEKMTINMEVFNKELKNYVCNRTKYNS